MLTILIVQLLITASNAFHIPFTLQHHKNKFSYLQLSSSSPEKVILNNPTDATSALESYTNLQNQYTVQNGNQGMGGGTSASKFWDTVNAEDLQSVADAVSVLAAQADMERMSQITTRDGGLCGRVMLGICAGDTAEAIQTLKEWVSGLKLPKGLLHGMDLDGQPIEIKGAVYIKYSTGGAMTFAEMRRSKRGFDALWRPGDAVLETYDGDFRGVYFNVELEDEIFRQYGVLPLNLFHASL